MSKKVSGWPLIAPVGIPNGSGLPEITNSDEGKVLTVIGEAERTEIIPEQSLTTTGDMIAEATIPNHADNPPESMTVEIEGVAYTNVQFDSSTESYTISDGSTTVGQIVIDGANWVFIKTPAGTYTLSAYIESPKEYSAKWTEASGGGSGVYVVIFDTPVTVGEASGFISDKTDTEIQTHFNTPEIIFANIPSTANVPIVEWFPAIISGRETTAEGDSWYGSFVGGGEAELLVISATIAQQMPALADYIGHLLHIIT